MKIEKRITCTLSVEEWTILDKAWNIMFDAYQKCKMEGVENDEFAKLFNHAEESLWPFVKNFNVDNKPKM